MLKVHFQLRQLLKIEKRIPNSLLEEVAEHTGLHQHQVRDMLYETKKGISFDSLGRIIDYLVVVKKIPRQYVLNQLFVTTAEDFWSMIANRDKIILCAGARQDPNYGDQYVVIASDSELQARVVSSVNGVPRDPPPQLDGVTSAPAALQARAIMEQLVPAPPKKEGMTEQVREVAFEKFKAFTREQRNEALVCLGSVKSNPMIEQLIAYCFDKAVPFQSEDGLATPDDRTVPFMFRYRPERDPHPPSCCGGTQLAVGLEDRGPGIHYKTDAPEWLFAPCNQEWDPALVFYHHEVATGRLCVVLGGFSSRGTRALAHFINTRAGELWAPSFENGLLQVGMFVIRFRFRETNAPPPTNPLDFVPPDERDIFVDRIPGNVLLSRLPERWLVAEEKLEDEPAEKEEIVAKPAKGKGQGAGKRAGK